MKIVPNLKKTRNILSKKLYFTMQKTLSVREKSLKSQLWLYLHIHFSIVASTCFVEMELCLFVHFSSDAMWFVKLNMEHFTPFCSTYRTQFLKQNLVRHKIKKCGLTAKALTLTMYSFSHKKSLVNVLTCKQCALTWTYQYVLSLGCLTRLRWKNDRIGLSTNLWKYNEWANTT